jgi:hypothetical protein
MTSPGHRIESEESARRVLLAEVAALRAMVEAVQVQLGEWAGRGPQHQGLFPHQDDVAAAAGRVSSALNELWSHMHGGSQPGQSRVNQNPQ